MPVTDDIMARARRSDRRAIEEVLDDSYPAVHRIAYALTGQAKLANRLIRRVLRRAARLMPTWRQGITPENWFYHHMLLTAREAAAHVPGADQDLLVTSSPSDAPEYVAFIRALRGLPRQQMEAFILHYGEKLNSRLLGVAMDCSSNAAATHLSAATEALQSINRQQFGALSAALERAYKTLTPPETLVHAAVRHETGSLLWRKRLKRLVRRVVLLVILAVAGYLVWQRHAVLLHWFEVLRARAAGQRM
jgi:DNA-directed RNA polymerase specialized sigma24 family protein